MMQRIRWFLLMFGISVLLVVSLVNTPTVPVKLPFVLDTKLPLSMLLLATSAISFVFGSLMTAWMLRARSKAKAAKAKAKTAEADAKAAPEPAPAEAPAPEAAEP